MWDNYIVIQGDDGVYYVDQCALTQRIAFEKMKKEVKGAEGQRCKGEKDESDEKGYKSPQPPFVKGDVFDISVLKPDVLLQPLLLEMPVRSDIDDKIVAINDL
ncbi:hypothetical protein KKH82_02750 [Patescibacteria group bacterium]|nr:hypothetical protein [Patescibacteria group bacterium]